MLSASHGSHYITIEEQVGIDLGSQWIRKSGARETETQRLDSVGDCEGSSPKRPRGEESQGRNGTQDSALAASRALHPGQGPG